ncbi:electron transport complex subunit RsxG [uncultured Oceanicoccus sp.]|uniref:electron transport complex subunit RsxG n=1 Tax=uncultured Oceanicoccus sp. TaxID=1706381 RepID=UPI0030D714C9
MLGKSIGRNALLLGLFAILSTAIIAGTYLSAKETIDKNIRMAEERALLEIIPKSRHNNSMLEDAHRINDSDSLGLRSEKQYYIARQDGEPVAVIFPATAREGYTGDIDMIIGINIDGTVAGVRVLSHRETPGLGDAIDIKKSPWINSFINKSLVNPTVDLWKVKKDKGVFDQFTGATITPRAVTKTVLQTLQYFNQHQQAILKQSITMDAEVKNYE